MHTQLLTRPALRGAAHLLVADLARPLQNSDSMEGFGRSVSGMQRITGISRCTDAAPLLSQQAAQRSPRCRRLVTRMSQQASPADLTVRGFDGKESGTATLSLKVADAEKAKGLVHRHVIRTLQNQRQGSANTKTRAEVRGGGKKPFTQKGTGNARQGSRRTPLKPGGGVIFGPKPKDWSIKMNKKERRLALATAIQSAAQDITVVDDIKETVSEVKTKALVAAISGLGIDLATDHVLLIVDKLSKEIELSARNIANLVLNESGCVSSYDVLRADRIVIDKASLAYINEFYGSSS